MALKTFNIDSEVYGEFSSYCKKEGLSMSKKIERFIKEEMAMIGSVAEKVEKMEKTESEHGVGKEVDDAGHPLSRYC